jgi:hypothetical protein
MDGIIVGVVDVVIGISESGGSTPGGGIMPTRP